jgi:hypothetical protein
VLRRRLLHQVVNGPRHDGRVWRWYRTLTRPRLPRWLRLSAPVPWRGSEAGSLVTRRTPAGRASLALAVVDGLSAAQAREVLNAAGVDVGDRSAAGSAADAPVPGADQLRPVVADFDASLVRCGPGWLSRSRRQRRALVAAGTVLVVIAAYLAAATAWNDASHSGDPVVTTTPAWTHAVSSGGDNVSDWPTEGNLAGDRPLLRAAAAAFSAGEQLGPGDSVYVLYAGDLSGTGPLVVMADADVPEAAVASYRRGDTVPLRQLGSFSTTDQTTPNLIPLPGGRLLVPPWRTDLRLAWLSGAGTPLAWQPLQVTNGIATMPAQRKVNYSTCFGRVAAIRYDDDTFGHSLRFTGTVLVAPPDGSLSAWPTEIEDTSPQNVPLLTLQELGDLTSGLDNADVQWIYDGGYQLDVQGLGHGTLPGPGGATVAAVTVDVQDASLRTPILAGNSPFDGTATEFISLSTGPDRGHRSRAEPAAGYRRLVESRVRALVPARGRSTRPASIRRERGTRHGGAVRVVHGVLGRGRHPRQPRSRPGRCLHHKWPQRDDRAPAHPWIAAIAQYLGPTNSSSLATASRRATEIVVGLENRQATPSRSSASPHNRWMSTDLLTNRYRGYSYHRSPSLSGRRTRLIPR